MKITQIRAVNFKGATIDHALAPATAIIGPNMAGKTAIVQAIRLALAGWLPECGKTARATWELSSGPDMLAAVFFEKGSLTRQFWLEGQSVKSSFTAVGVPLNGTPVDFENLPLLNAEAYFAMTESERTAYVFERVTLPDSYTAKSIIAECERLSFEEDHTEQIEEAKGATVERVRGYFEPLSVQAGDPSLSNEVPTIQVALTDALNGFRELFTYHNKRAKDTQGAVRTLAELKLREPNVFAAAVGTKEELEELQKEMDAINTETGSLNAKIEGARARKARQEYLRGQIYAKRPDYAADIAKLAAKKASHEADLAKEMTAAARGKLQDQLKEENQLAGLAETLKQQQTVIREAEAQLREISELVECPYCHSKEADWRKHLKDGAEERIRVALAVREETDAAMKKMNAKVVELEGKWLANEEIVKANARLQTKIRDVVDQLSVLERQKASDEAALKANREEFEKIEETETAAVDCKSRLGELALSVKKLEERRTQLRAAAQAEVELRRELKLAAQAELEHQGAAAHVSVIKRIAELLKEKREAMVTEVFTGLLKVANEVVAPILKSPLALHENTVGRWDGAKFIPHRVFSGTEKALTYIAIAVALSAQAPLRLVILDEFGRLDEVNQILVLRRLTSCVLAKIIDQFIIVGTSLPMEAVAVSKQMVPFEVIKV